MITVILTRLLLFLLPFLLYGVAVWLARKGLLSWKGSWREAPNLFLASVGLALVVSSFFWLSLGGEDHKNEIYVPAHVVDGEVVPGRFVPRDELTPEQAAAARRSGDDVPETDGNDGDGDAESAP